MIFMTCSTVTPGFGVRIVSTPVILGCGGVDWPCAKGASVSERAKRLAVPADLPVLRDRETLERVLASFGAKFVSEVSDPAVIAVFRLAIAEVVQAPEVARALNSIGREASRAALSEIM